jgi:hypothetical protein
VLYSTDKNRLTKARMENTGGGASNPNTAPGTSNSTFYPSMPDLGATFLVNLQNSNNGFCQAMLKTALETTPQLTEENYSIWKDKMTGLLELRGVLATLNSPVGTSCRKKTLSSSFFYWPK